jgi:hypothetical protein
MNKFKIAMACALLVLATAKSHANGPNLLDSSWDTDGALGDGSTQTITDTPGAEYIFSFTSDGYGAYTPTFYLWWEYNTASEYQAFATVVPDGSATWHIDVTGTGSDEVYLQIESNGPLTPSGATYSDFSLVEVTNTVPDVASTPSLLGLCLLGLGALRRKLR